jgi:hypothetical protein
MAPSSASYGSDDGCIPAMHTHVPSAYLDRASAGHDTLQGPGRTERDVMGVRGWGFLVKFTCVCGENGEERVGVLE